MASPGYDNVVAALGGVRGPADTESELGRAFRNHFVLARRAEGKTWLERAMADGELRPELDLDVALDLLYGPLIFRLLMGHAPLDQAFVDRVLDDALLGIGAAAQRALERKPTG